MKSTFYIVFFLFLTVTVSAQIDANSVMGMPTATTAEMTAIVGPNIGSVLFNTDDQAIYRYTTSGWVISSDDQYDDEVLLRTALDVNEGGVGSPTNETNVEEVIQAIAPITSKAARVFYPPSIAIDASTNGNFNVNLYTQYTAQFATPTAVSTGAPTAVPTYVATDLYYYVTYADPLVFNTTPGAMTINASGVLSYEIIGQPADYNSLINVVFVVK
ncbi:hypothetical protein [uncultured Eudoraea sp.]|uniref:hypothetical protein n=1 Tax=uncultured Eudoraea sp. TaxID=1035614 RepID=UPI002633FA49|nr:hypothetical protein [uncultured Eudoraea sp.]